jgi:hypothetical protein
MNPSPAERGESRPSEHSERRPGWGPLKPSQHYQKDPDSPSLRSGEPPSSRSRMFPTSAMLKRAELG